MICWALSLPAATHAQPGKYSASIILPEIQMRAGASWQFPATGKFKKGEQVIVHHEDGSWVAIIPPPGTVSWVNHRFLGEFDPNGTGKQNALVMAENVEVRVGSEKGTPLSVAQVKVPRGTWVEVIGGKIRDDNSIWYPITPPEGEFRWLPKEALGAAAPLAPPPQFVKSDLNEKPIGSLTSLSPKPEAAANVPQWDKAESAERSGDYGTAEKLYTLIYMDLKQKKADHELQLICYNRIIKCQERLKLDGQPLRTSTALPNPGQATLQPPNGSSQNTGAVGVAWPAQPQQQQQANGGQRWSGPGNLRRAGFAIDGKQAYALENARGQLLYYITAGNNLALDGYVNKQVDLLGVSQVRGDIRGGQYMVATQVNLIR